ncbi:DNA-binding transcriptional regulator, GntR family [Arthrobacter subterraneus]|uniref:DNA-binding transcriptional regulator, GntR family n=1 Tax=Arthrobacter subterraneus TaxID=335973 RepID=A0A1G8KYW5_9MICC|nr:GntR family transcriptional regulator [Arthrobacter subterraneus]SDI48537.1 DNA-binding transcriptional regulator, GntR family [Arthrobacter subterraneus]
MQPAGDEEAAPKQRVQDEIRRDIIFGSLPPGTRVTETALATKYGISRVPVREALRALEAEGFVESKPYAGSTVSKIPVDDAEDLFFVREALESATARRAARRAAAQFDSGAPSSEWWNARKLLAGILDEGDAAVAQNRLDLLPELNIRFHLGIAELSGSSSLTALLRQIAGKIEWLYATDVDNRGKESWGEHRSIIAAIDAGNFADAEKLMANHVHQSKEGYLDRFSTEQS